jgi:hypothetical protein
VLVFDKKHVGKREKRVAEMFKKVVTNEDVSNIS